jgi:ADP-heptose:LPS heptosyltransferase
MLPRASNILFMELLGGIGDVLIALPAIQALARSHPGARLTVLTFAPGGELLRNHPLIHQVILIDRDEVRQAVDTVLDGQAFDLIVTDTGDTGIGRAIRDSGAEHVTNLRRSLTPHVLVGEQFLRILMVEELIDPGTITRPRLYPTPDEQDRARAALGEIRHPVVFFFPDAGAEIKCWPTENFIALGKALRQRYDASIIIPAGDDPARAAGIAGEIGGAARAWPRGSLRDLAATIEGADLMVAADTGVARIAAALKVPTITLFGPSWYAHFGQPAPHLSLQGYSECPERVVRDFTVQRCWINGVCPFGYWRTCLETISHDEVLDAAASFLDPHAPGRWQPPSGPRYSAYPA